MENEIKEVGESKVKRLVVRLEEMGGTLMLIGLTCLFIYLTLSTSLGFGVPVFTIILGAGAVFATKLVRKMVPDI